MYIDEKINKENLQQLFSSDLLYKELLKDDHNEEALFPPFIKKFNLTKVYTSEEVSGMLNKKDSSIRYYISVLFDYIQPMKQGRNYRYDYISNMIHKILFEYWVQVFIITPFLLEK